MKLYKEKGKSTVYLIENGKKRPIFSAKVFEDRGYSWNDIKEFDNLDEYPLGELIGKELTVNEGELLKETKTSTVYLIEDGKKRPIFHAKVFEELGYNWNSIKIVEDLGDIETGEIIGGPAQLKEGDLVKTFDKTDVYLLESGTKRPIFNGKVFEKSGYDWNDVIEVSDLSAFPVGVIIY